MMTLVLCFHEFHKMVIKLQYLIHCAIATRIQWMDFSKFRKEFYPLKPYNENDTYTHLWFLLNGAKDFRAGT
jgi:ribosomal protein S26